MIASGNNNLSPGECQAITWTNAVVIMILV